MNGTLRAMICEGGHDVKHNCSCHLIPSNAEDPAHPTTHVTQPISSRHLSHAAPQIPAYFHTLIPKSIHPPLSTLSVQRNTRSTTQLHPHPFTTSILSRAIQVQCQFRAKVVFRDHNPQIGVGRVQRNRTGFLVGAEGWVLGERWIGCFGGGYEDVGSLRLRRCGFAGFVVVGRYGIAEDVWLVCLYRGVFRDMTSLV